MQVVFKKKLGILVMVGVQGLERANYGNLTNQFHFVEPNKQMQSSSPNSLLLIMQWHPCNFANCTISLLLLTHCQQLHPTEYEKMWVLDEHTLCFCAACGLRKLTFLNGPPKSNKIFQAGLHFVIKGVLCRTGKIVQNIKLYDTQPKTIFDMFPSQQRPEKHHLRKEEQIVTNLEMRIGKVC